MDMIGALNDRKDKPSWVRFERRAMEDKAATLAAGHYVAKDVDYALITAPYSRDVFHTKVSDWMVELESQRVGGRINPEWVDHYKKLYKAWQAGEEMPLTGTAIKGWGVISPAQQKTLIEMGIHTVEDLCSINDEGMKRIGMGALELKNKANGWISQLKDKGPLTVEIASVKKENANLSAQVATMQKQIEQLTAMIQKPEVPQVAVVEVSDEDVLGSPAELYEQKFGKPPHHRMKPESILAALKG
jgi:hypothetical protein